MKEANKIILYQDDDEITRVSVRFADEDLWLTQNQLADIYCTTQENISMHIRNIYADRELDENRTYKKFLLVRQEGNRQVIIYNRVDNKKPFVGMTNFKGNYVTRDDVKIAKNYLSEIELQRLNLLVSGFLDFAEFQALEMNPMTMKDCIEALDNQIIAHKRKVLIGKGNVSHKQAIEKAEKEFEIYRKREMDMLESDFDKEVKRLKDKEQIQ